MYGSTDTKYLYQYQVPIYRYEEAYRYQFEYLMNIGIGSYQLISVLYRLKDLVSVSIQAYQTS